MTTHSCPETRPTPVMMPAPGAASPYRPMAASGDSSRKGEPGSSSSFTRSRGSSLPRPACLARAASPPPIATRSSFSRRSVTSADIAPAFAWNSSEPGFSLLLMAGMSPAAGGEPLVDLLEPVRSPEWLAVDHDVGRTEGTDCDGLLDLRAGAVLYRLIVDPRTDLIRVQAELRADGDSVVGAGNVHVVDEIGAVEGLAERLRPRRVFRLEPVEG